MATPAATRQNFTFTLDQFKITDTRSRHKDSDYVSFTLMVKTGATNGPAHTLKKSMRATVNNGTFKVGLSFPNVTVEPDQTVVLNYLIVNSGHKSESEVYSALDTAGSKLATSGLVAGGAALGSLIPIPGLGTILGAVGGWLIGKLGGILDPNCDGTVAAEQLVLSYNDLLAKTAHGNFSHETKHPGSDSADGCGGNSMYYVDWHIEHHSTLGGILAEGVEKVKAALT